MAAMDADELPWIEPIEQRRQRDREQVPLAARMECHVVVLCLEPLDAARHDRPDAASLADDKPRDWRARLRPPLVHRRDLIGHCHRTR